MKKIESHLGESLKPVKLYKEDIQEILRVLSKLDQETKIRVNQYELESIDELENLPDKSIHTLVLSTHGENYVSVNFNESSVFLYANDNKPAQKGIYQELKELLISKKDWLSILAHTTVLSGLYTGISIWFISDAITKEENAGLNWSAGMFMLITGILWAVFGVRKQSKNFSRIYSESRPDNKNFWIRNSDQLVIMLLSVTLATAGALIIAKFT